MSIFDITVTKANRVVSFACESLPTVTMDGQPLPAESVAYILDYGMRQCLIDPTAGVKRESFDSDEKFHAAAWEKAGKRYDQLASGKVPTARTPADPKTVEARKLAATLMSSGLTADDIAAFIASRKESTVAADSTLIPADKLSTPDQLKHFEAMAAADKSRKSRKAHA